MGRPCFYAFLFFSGASPNFSTNTRPHCAALLAADWFIPTSEIIVSDANQSHYGSLKTLFQILVSVNRNGNPQVLALFYINVMTAGNACQRPSLTLENLAHPLSADRLHIRQQAP